MRLIDLLDLEPADRVTRIWRRLIPLGERGYGAFPESVKDFFVVYEWLGEVSNGGVPQYFTNSSGGRAEDLRAALKRLGDADALALFEKTLAVFGGAVPADRGERVDAYSALNKKKQKELYDLSDRVNESAPRLAQALAALALREAKAFAFLDRHPGGFKALPIPEDLRRSPTWDAFETVTFAYAALGNDPQARDFLDVFAWADEVSAAGFESWFFSREAARASGVLKLLKKMKQAGAADLLRRALAVFPAPPDLKKRRAKLAALGDKVRAKLAELSREFQALRGQVTLALADVVAPRL